MRIWIEGVDRSDLKKAALWILFSMGFFSGFLTHWFIVWSDKILGG